MKKLLYILGAVLVVVIVIGYFVANCDQGTDETQILAAIERGRTGIEEKDLSKAMSAISPNYKDEAGNNFDGIRLFGVQLFRSGATYSVSVKNPAVTINQNEAEVKAEVAIGVKGQDFGLIPPRVVTLQMKKEPARRLLIYKVPQWKVTAMVNASPLIDDNM